MKIKYRKFHREIYFDAEGAYICPRQKQRPCVNIAMCLGRKSRRHRGCVTCTIPGQIQRALERRKTRDERMTGSSAR